MAVLEYETSTIDYMIYTKFYQASANFGFATALAVILLIIIMILTFVEMYYTIALVTGNDEEPDEKHQA